MPENDAKKHKNIRFLKIVQLIQECVLSDILNPFSDIFVLLSLKPGNLTRYEVTAGSNLSIRSLFHFCNHIKDLKLFIMFNITKNLVSVVK